MGRGFKLQNPGEISARLLCFRLAAVEATDSKHPVLYGHVPSTLSDIMDLDALWVDGPLAAFGMTKKGPPSGWGQSLKKHETQSGRTDVQSPRILGSESSFATGQLCDVTPDNHVV